MKLGYNVLPVNARIITYLIMQNNIDIKWLNCFNNHFQILKTRIR